METVLGAEAGRQFCAAFDVTAAGNWEGKSILHRPRPLKQVAANLNVAEETLAAGLADSKAKLLAHRNTRPRPGRDEKVLTAWNGLMMAAFAEAGRVFNNPAYLAAALKNARFLLAHLTRDGRLLRTWKDGRATLAAYLEDYAFLADGLLALYQSTFDERWFIEARRLMDTVLAHF
ncbi:MAG: thioredoxin domain-containing protein, partial [Anaerolineae bacterium]